MSSVAPQRRRRGNQHGMTLVELLIGMTIMSVISAMIIMGWFALSDSYSYSVSSSVARDNAREALARMEREIRDAQSNPTGAEAALLRARPRSIMIDTTFNRSGNDNPSMLPRPVMFRLYPNGQLWRFEDRPNASGVYDGVISGVETSVTTDVWGTPNPYSDLEQNTGEGGRLLAKNVVNDNVVAPATPMPLFHYSYYQPNGDLAQDTSVSTVTNRSRIVAVQINLLVDLNPKRAPVYTELQTTAQLRNQR